MSSDSKTKYIILVPDGMSDTSDADVCTPLGDAATPWLDKMAACGAVGLTRTVPEGMEPGSDVANLSIMGYSPQEVYTGRAPFEAASMGVTLRENDTAFRCNFVTLDRNYTMMADYSADHISTPEANELARYFSHAVDSFGLTLYPGVSYRNLLVWNDGPRALNTFAPHNIPNEPIDKFLPAGEGADVLIRLILKSWKVLEHHPINLNRTQRCLGPANSIWPWGQGRPPKLEKLSQRFGITGSVVAAVDLVRGIGKYAGLDVIDVPGATGYLDTNYEGKVSAALRELKDKDFVFLHVEAPDEAGHSGQKDLKIKAIEDFDERIVGPMLKGLGDFAHWRVLLMPDHCTPIALRTHTSEPSPFVLLDSREWDPERTDAVSFSERLAAQSGNTVDKGWTLIEKLLDR